MQYDLREPHDCAVQRSVLICLAEQSEVKCVAVNPTKPHFIAVGVNDCYIRMYDRRMIKPINVQVADTESNQKIDRPDSNCVQYYAPGHLAVENASMLNFKLVATYVAFNSAGTEMLVNMGGEQIYLFDINNSRHINELKMPQFNFKNIDSTSIKCHCVQVRFINKIICTYNMLLFISFRK